MEYYQQAFQTCSFLSISDAGATDLPSCLNLGHVFYERSLQEIEVDVQMDVTDGLAHEQKQLTADVERDDSSDNPCADPFKIPDVMGLNATKAGMSGLKVDQINAKIMQISEGSKFHEHKKKQQEKINKKVEDMKRKMRHFTAEQIHKAQHEVDSLVQTIEADMDLTRYYVHVDMDSFFASVEMRDDPSLRDIPMAVGSDSMLSTSNYEARTYGVRAGMPGFIAKKLCPDLKIVPCNFKKYQEASKVVEETIKPYDQNLLMCMDEADLDITDLLVASVGNGITAEDKRNRDNCAYNVVKEMRDKIFAATNLTASAGIAPTRFLAKLCSDMRKPNGQLMLANRKPAIMAFLSMIPVRKVCGIGAVTEQLLKGIGIENCKHLWEQRAILSLLCKRAMFQNLLGIAIGTGSSVFREHPSLFSGDRKSLSCERTFIGTSDLGFLENMCKSLCCEIEKDLKSAGLSAKTITLKIKTTDYDVKTRARSIMQSTNSAERIYQAAWRIYLSYASEIPDLTIRLMGVRVSSFHETNTKLKESNGRTGGGQKMIDEFFRDNTNVTATLTSNTTTGSSGAEHVPPPAPVDEPVATAAPASATVTSPALEGKNEKTNRVVNCPVCNKQFKLAEGQTPEAVMDFHIDDCLSKSTVREVRSQIVALPPPKKRISCCAAAGNEPKRVKMSMTSFIDTYFNKVEK